MSCHELAGGVHICTGPATRREVTDHKRSAAWCPKCRQRRVQTLVLAVPIEPSYYEPAAHWECPCDGKVLTY